MCLTLLSSLLYGCLCGVFSTFKVYYHYYHPFSQEVIITTTKVINHFNVFYWAPLQYFFLGYTNSWTFCFFLSSCCAILVYFNCGFERQSNSSKFVLSKNCCSHSNHFRHQLLFDCSVFLNWKCIIISSKIDNFSENLVLNCRLFFLLFLCCPIFNELNSMRYLVLLAYSFRLVVFVVP